jgi:hypothetical protein
MNAPDPQAGPRSYVSEVSCPPPVTERQALHLPMREPEPDPEAEAGIEADWLDEWDDADSNAYQARVEAGLEPQAGP